MSPQHVVWRLPETKVWSPTNLWTLQTIPDQEGRAFKPDLAGKIWMYSKLRPKPVWPHRNLAIQTSHQWSQCIFQGMVCSPLRMKRPGRNHYVSQCLFVLLGSNEITELVAWIFMELLIQSDLSCFQIVFSMADTIEVPSWMAQWSFVTATGVSTGGAVLRITHHRVETPGCRERKCTRWPVFSYLSCPTWSLLNVCKKTSHGHHTEIGFDLQCVELL